MKPGITNHHLRVRTQIQTGFDNQFDCGEGCDNACRWEALAFTPAFFKLRSQMDSAELAKLNACSNRCYDQSCKNLKTMG